MVKQIPIVENILSANDEIAVKNRRRLDEAGVYGINLMASPGAGKTSLLEQTIQRLRGRLRVAVIEGDTAATSIDAERTEKAGAASVQINTGGNCHLEAHMIGMALDQLDLSEVDLLVVENVGNLVCPAGWKLGTHRNVLVASIPEGDDKPYKYPGMYHNVQTLIINKIDLLPYVPFNMDFFQKGVAALNADLTTFPLSCVSGEGVDAWIDWLVSAVEAHRTNPAG